jgi:hypothetical protein
MIWASNICGCKLFTCTCTRSWIFLRLVLFFGEILQLATLHNRRNYPFYATKDKVETFSSLRMEVLLNFWECTCTFWYIMRHSLLMLEKLQCIAVHKLLLQYLGTPCPSCDAALNCVWDQHCSVNETCMVRAMTGHGFQFSIHCISVS